MTKNSEPKQKSHLFQPGQSGNPAGKPKGAKNHATRAAQALIDGKAELVVEKALELALSGDGPILKAILDRLCPPRKDSPIRVELPPMACAADLPRATESVLAAVADGSLTPSEATAVAGLLEAHRRALETSDLAIRIEALEANRSAENGR